VGSALRARISIALYAALCYSFAALFLLAGILAQGIPLWPGSSSSWLFLILLTLGPQLLGHTVLNYLLAEVRPAFLTLTILVEPVAATIWAFLIFGEVPSSWAMVGGALILLALVIIPRQSIWKSIPARP
jgi:drug/metabolite transporter (DMT)-like permease